MHTQSVRTSDQENRGSAGRVKECAWYVVYLQMAKSMTQRLNGRVMVLIADSRTK